MVEQFPRSDSMALTTRESSKKNSARWWLLLLTLCVGQISTALTLPRELHYRVDISEQWTVLVDTTGSATLDEIRSRRYEFIPALQFQAPLPPLQSYWLRLSLQNSESQKKTSWLEIDAPLARNILLVQIDGPFIKAHSISTGNSEGMHHRQALAHFPIVIPPESTAEIYVNLTRPWRTQFSATLSDPLSHRKSTDRSLSISGFCYGGLLLLMLGALLMRWTTGRFDYLLLALLAAAATLNAAIYQGILLQLAPVNNSGSRLLQLAPLVSQTLFIIALLLSTRGIQLTGTTGRGLRLIQWGGILVCTGLLMIALFDFGLAYYGLALAESLTLLALLLYFVGLLAQGHYRLMVNIAGLTLYSLGSWPLLSGALGPLAGFHDSGATGIAGLDSSTRYQAGLLLMLLLFAIGLAIPTRLTPIRNNTRQTEADTDHIEADVNPVDSLSLEHLTVSSMPGWWRLTEGSFDGIILCEHGRVLHANQPAADLLGYDKVEMIGQPFSLLVGSDSDSETLLSLAAGKPVLLDTHTGDNTRPLQLRSRQQWVDHRHVNFASLRRLPGDNKDNATSYDGLAGDGLTELAEQQRSSERIEPSPLVTSRPELGSSLREALRQNSFTLSLEAIMELQEENRIGSKAGLCWPKSPPDYRPIDRLYALAQDLDLEGDISTRVLQAAARFAAGPASAHNAGLLCIKIAEAHFWQQDFTDEVHDIVSQPGGIPQQIMLVFDEAVLASQVQKSIRKLRQLEQMGCQVGIDHFTDKHTSLRLLGSCAINQISTSTSWIKSMGTRRQDLKAIRALVKLCHRLHIQVLIDQVSTENHLKVAQLIGFDRASGPLIEQMLQT